MPGPEGAIEGYWSSSSAVQMLLSWNLLRGVESCRSCQNFYGSPRANSVGPMSYQYSKAVNCSRTTAAWNPYLGRSIKPVKYRGEVTEQLCQAVE